MCYNTKQSRKTAEIEKLRAVFVPNDLPVQGIFNGFEFPKTPVITNNKQEEVQLFNWGLIPHWAKDVNIRKKTLNARIESLDEKPSFKHHESHRCLILADAFFEWKWLDGKGRKKQKYEIGLEDSSLFAFAGIWSEWNNPKGEKINTYSIVTTEAQGIMREIHNSKLRMPVILDESLEKDWLAGCDPQEVIGHKKRLLAKTNNLQSNLFD